MDENFNRKSHWENIYENKALEDVSWYEPKPQVSLDLITQMAVTKNIEIIDIGGGDSFLVDNLLQEGFENVSLLDISEAALHRAQKRLGSKSLAINWINTDITKFEPTKKYDIWHDRAAFHFLTETVEIEKYVNIVSNAMAENGKLILGTFSENGPKKCSGIEIKQYGEQSLADVFQDKFKPIKSFKYSHKTPFDTTQEFQFVIFEKIKNNMPNGIK